MAVPINFEESNDVLGKPDEMTEEQCSPLCIARGKTTEGIPLILSCWKFTDIEWEEIARTKKVWIGIVGEGMPPVVVMGKKPEMSFS